MRAAFYTGATGLVAFQEELDVTGNNLANCNTYGYKEQKTSFRELLSSQMRVNGANPPLVGNGVQSVQNGIDPGEAVYEATQRPLDLAVSGNGWFCVENGGQREYTRDGSFSISLSGRRAYLVNRDGKFVLDSAGRPIQERVDSDSAAVELEAMADRVGVFTFPNPEALTPVSSGCYLANGSTGAAAAASDEEYTVRKGYLEQSGVSLVDEMAALITAQRGYQLSARVVQTADEMEQTANSLRS